MTPAQLEAEAIVASDSFTCHHDRPHDPDLFPCDADPAGIENAYATRAASAWSAETARHLTRVGLLLAAAAGIEPGHVLESLARRYARP